MNKFKREEIGKKKRGGEIKQIWRALPEL